MKKEFILLFSLVLLTACGPAEDDPGQAVDKESEVSVKNAEEMREELLAGFEVPRIEELKYKEDPPVYFYLFTHTEDHINHELSEDRYWRIGEMLEDAVKENPDMPLTWTIEFQGADAQTLLERNEKTGVVDYVNELQENGLVEPGYHAHHDPTYMERPQNDLKVDSSFEEVYEAISTWVTCEKDPLVGGCVSKEGGGIQAIKEAFGAPQVVTGVGTIGEVLIERSAGSKAINEELPDRLLGFGFADHGASTKIPGYAENREAFMNLMAPNNDTSSGAFWMDNAVRINDGIPLQELGTINLLDGPKDAEKDLALIERTRPEIMNVIVASKYIYTRTGTSPTKWAYAHSDDPELPKDQQNSENDIKKNYILIAEAFDLVVDFVKGEGGEFVSSQELVDLYTSKDYWEVDDEELLNMTIWFLNEWDGAPPAWVYDGSDYYSLSDYFYFLYGSLGFGDEIESEEIMRKYYGPWEIALEEVDGATVMVDEFLEMLEEVEFENRSIPVSFKLAGGKLEPAQVLYAMALYSLSLEMDLKEEALAIPAMTTAPETFFQLNTLGCEGCLDTVWSLKPARFQ
jgi:hypothetical protein